MMGVDISVWRCRIGTFNASIRRSSSKRVKKSLTLPGGNGVPVVILAAAGVLLLVVAGEVRYCQHHKHSGSTSLLSVPFCAGGSALAHRSGDAVTPVTVSSKVSTQEVVGALCPVTTVINFDHLPWRGRYATLQPVALCVRETLGFYMTSEPFCQHSSIHLSVLNTHPLHSPPPHFSSSPLLATPVCTSATDTTTADHQSSHTTALTAGSSYVLTIQSSHNTAQGCIGVLDVSVILILLLLMAGDVELNPGPGKYSVDHNNAMKSIGFEVTVHVTNIGMQGYSGTGKTSTLNLITGEKSDGKRKSTGFASRRMYMATKDMATKDSTVWENVSTDRMSELVCEAMVFLNQQKEALKKDAQQKKAHQKDAQQKESQQEDAQQKESQQEDAQQKESQQEDAQQEEAQLKDAQQKEAQRGVQQKDAQQEGAQNKDPQPLNNKHPNLEDEDTSSESSSSWPHTEPASATSSSPQHSKKDLDPYSVFPDLLRQLTNAKGSGVIFESHWMVVTDCGGQPPFFDAAALFHRNRCLHIFPVKLNECLEDTPKFTYFLNGKDACLTNIFVPQTNLQVIETLAKSAAAVQPTSTQSESDSQQGTACTSKFIVVGTFSDEMDDCSETVQEKKEKLKKALSPYKRIHMFDQGNAIVQIHATTKDEKKRKEYVTKLKKLIEDSGTALKYKVKLRFFVLLLSMNKMAEMEEKAVLHIDECIQLGKHLDMDESETIEAIHFFHNIGQIMYFDTSYGMSRDTSCKLDDFVIVKDEPVLERVSKLLSVPFIRRDSFNGNFGEHKRLFSGKAPSLSPEDSTLSEKTQTKFQQYGEFDPKDLQFLQLTEKELEFFLAMLEYVKAIAKTASGKYFMPCALPYTPASKQEVLNRFSEYVWIIKFERVLGETPEFIPVPVGYLPALYVILLTCFDEIFATSGKHQYRDCITLVYKNIWNVCIVERHLQLEVYFTGCEFTTECSDIRKFVLEAMMETDRRLRIDQLSINKIDCFLCSCGEGSSCHLCTYRSNIVKCEEHPESHLELSDNQRIWIQSGNQTDESKQDNNSTNSTGRRAPAFLKEPINAFKYLGYWRLWLLSVVIVLLHCVVYQSYKLYSMKPSVAPDSPFVYGETVLTVVGDKPQELRWPDYGFYLDIPEGALPPDVTASVTVKVISGDQFELPENNQLISAVYWISSSEIFLKEVAVSIQHRAFITSENQLSKFKFVIAKGFQDALPYNFNENGRFVFPNHFKARDGLFRAHTQYGTIKLSQFSLIAVTAPPDTKTLSTGLIYYKQLFTDPLTARFVKDIKAFLQVAKDEVSNFQVGRRIPHCALELQLLGGKTRRLLHKVDLTGVASPDLLCYSQPENNPQNLLKKEPRLHHLQECLFEMANKWFGLGICLQVKSGKLESLSHNVGMSDTDRLLQVFIEWNNSRCSYHTFENLIHCLKIIDMNRYIEKIMQMLEKNRASYSEESDYSEYRTV